MLDVNNIAFAKGLPSIFVIATPLQVLCAIEAIKEFEIEDYLIIFQCYEGEIRNAQVIDMFDIYKLKYQTYHIKNKMSYISLFYDIFFNNNKKYERIFIGDFNNSISGFIGLAYQNKKSVCVYLDDGTSSIPVLKGINFYTSFRYLLLRNLLNFSYWLKGIKNNFFFTLYYDINTSKIVYPNNFNHVFSNRSEQTIKRGVYFIGTNSSRYTECYLDGNENLYKKILFDVLNSLKQSNPGKELFYIPHGRDNCNYIQDFCHNNSITFMRLNQSVESFFVNNKICPEIVSGFVSSALFNLKKIFSESQVINYFPVVNNSNWKQKNIETSLYYQKHGIDYVFINADNDSY